MITLLGCIGAGWLLRYIVAGIWNGCRWLFARRGDGYHAAVQVLGISSAIIILLPLAIKEPFDRYLLACVPGFLLCIAAAPGRELPFLRWQRWLVSSFIIGSAVFAVAGTHDYLAWNRARWQALDYLGNELKIPPTNIDGGFEFNGWHLFDPDYKGDLHKTWWWVNDDEFTVTFGLIESHRIIKPFPYPRWCPTRCDYIYVIERSDINADSIKMASLHRDGGRNVKTPDGNILRYWNGRNGPVNIAHGSFVRLEPGCYRALFKLAVGRAHNRECKNAGILRVVNHLTGQMLAESGIENTGAGRCRPIEQELPFSIQTNLCVAVHVIGREFPLWLDSVRFVENSD